MEPSRGPTGARPEQGHVAPAALLLGAAAIHFAVAPEHVREYPLYGLLFICAGVLQAGLAVALLRLRSRALAAAGVASSLGLIAVWALSRTTGLPVAPVPWTPEAVGLADVSAGLLEAATAALLVADLATAGRPVAAGRWRQPAALAAAALLTVSGVTGVLRAAAPAGGAAAMPGMGGFGPAAGTSAQPPAAAGQPGGGRVDVFTLVAQTATIGGATEWTFGGTVPGPELRVTQGDRVRVTLVNHLPVSTTIHWHGIRVANAEDGVPGVTQDAVASGATYTYDFTVPDAGTYWYHSHQDTFDQILRGLFGPLVVEPRGGAVAESRDYPVMLYDGPGGWAVNGTGGDLHLDAGPGERVRLRLIDAAAPGMLGTPPEPVLVGAPYRVVALDGQDVRGPQTLGAERLELGMGHRLDVAFTMPERGSVRLLTAGGGPTVTVGSGPAPAPPARDDALPLFDMTQYGTPAPDPLADATHYDATFPLVLDTQGLAPNAGTRLRQTINGDTSDMGPMFEVRQGWLVRLHVVNDTAEWHPIHLHGHELTVVSKDGQRVAGSPLHLDTIVVGPHETWDVVFRADNPGLWMLHCHNLLHARMGMTAMVRYQGFTTPYQLGGPAGNQPH